MAPNIPWFRAGDRWRKIAKRATEFLDQLKAVAVRLPFVADLLAAY